MNAESALVGAMPGSNQIKQAESALVALKTDKIMEITRASTDVVNVIQKARENPLLKGLQIDLNQMLSLLFGDKHFMNSK
jgi:hypothetical protein